MNVWYLSYADDDGFRGAVILEAESWLLAVAESRKLGLSPGRQVVVFEVPPVVQKLLEGHMGRLLSEGELLKTGLFGGREPPEEP